MGHLNSTVGVVIPVHNSDEFINDAINSVIGQDHSGNFVTVIVDDGSDVPVINVINKEFPFMTTSVTNWVINNSLVETKLQVYELDLNVDCHKFYMVRLPKATGPSNARNLGLELLFIPNNKVEIVAFLDADDMMVDNKVSTLLPVFDNPEVGAVYADYYHLYDNGDFAPEIKEIYSAYRFLEENIGPNCTSLVTKEALLAVKENGEFFDSTMRTCEDYDLFMRISEKFSIKHVAELCTFLRVHSNNSTSTVSKQQWVSDRRRVSEKIQQRIQQSSDGQ